MEFYGITSLFTVSLVSEVFVPKDLCSFDLAKSFYVNLLKKCIMAFYDIKIFQHKKSKPSLCVVLLFSCTFLKMFFQKKKSQRIFYVYAAQPDNLNKVIRFLIERSLHEDRPRVIDNELD